MEVYLEQTKPLSRVYEQRGILVEIDGLGTIEEVQERIREAVQGR